jgi:hypothetical protein
LPPTLETGVLSLHGADRIASNDAEQSNARSVYDMTFPTPKSVSIMVIRVRLAGLNENRTTGNWIVASYTHDTSTATT